MRVRIVSMLALASIVLAFSPAPVVAARDVTPATAESAPKAAAKLAVQVTGRVKNAGDYALDDGARLSDALAAAGTYAYAPGDTTLLVDAARTCKVGDPDLQRVYLVRTNSKSPPEHLTYQIDFTLARDRHDLRYDPLLRQNDKIIVPECRPTAVLIAHPPRPR